MTPLHFFLSARDAYRGIFGREFVGGKTPRHARARGGSNAFEHCTLFKMHGKPFYQKPKLKCMCRAFIQKMTRSGRRSFSQHEEFVVACLQAVCGCFYSKPSLSGTTLTRPTTA